MFNKNDHKKRIVIYAVRNSDAKLDGYRSAFLLSLKKDFDYIMVVLKRELEYESQQCLYDSAIDFLLCQKQNDSIMQYWHEGIQYIGWDKLQEYDELFLADDSFFGPFFSWNSIITCMEQSEADCYGIFNETGKHCWDEPEKASNEKNDEVAIECFFYFIKENLLHSTAFAAFWDRRNHLQEKETDSSFACRGLFRYLCDNGFKIETYQNKLLHSYCFNTTNQSMLKLIKEEKIPFASIRPFNTDLKEEALQAHYGKDPRETLKYIEKNTDYDVNLIWDYILRTGNLSDIWNQLQLEYVIPKNCVEKPYRYDKPIAVILHIYYEDLVEHIAEYCVNFPPNTFFYITTITEKAEKIINQIFQNKRLLFECKIRPNVGVAMSSLWVTYAEIVTSGKYEYICYFHDKKSPYTQYSIHGEQFAERCYENLIGTPDIVKNIVNLFEDNPRLGLLGAPMIYHGNYFCVSWKNWAGNYENTVNLANELGLKVSIDKTKMPVAPYGDMFWFRTAALKRVIGHGYKYKDFDVLYAPDFTKLHAFERIYSFAAQDSGYYYAEVINSDNARSDLVNYQYMFYKQIEILLKHGYYPDSYSKSNEMYEKQFLNKYRVKGIIKSVLPESLWIFMRKVYLRLSK